MPEQLQREAVAASPPDGLVQARAATRRLQLVMQQAGWEIHYVDIDITGDTPRAEIKVMRTDGRWLWARVDGRGCTLERFHRDRYLGKPAGRTGRQPLSPQADDRFFGRTRPSGPRALLRELTAYIADNALGPVTLADLRAAWAPLTQGRHVLDALPSPAAPADDPNAARMSPRQGRP